MLYFILHVISFEYLAVNTIVTSYTLRGNLAVFPRIRHLVYCGNVDCSIVRSILFFRDIIK